MANILVVDDELGIRDLLSEILNDEGHSVELAANATEARVARNSGNFDLVLLDIWMPDTDGVSLPVIMMSGHATIETAVEATRIGALSFLEKPITMQKLLKAVEQGLAKSASTPPAKAPGAMIGAAPAGAAPVAERMTYSTDAAVVRPVANACQAADSVPSAHQGFDLDRPLREARDGFEKAYFEFHLAREGGSMTRVAEKTGLERTHLYRKLRQLGVVLGRSRRG